MSSDDLRESLIGLLQLIASFVEQVKYQNDVPNADVPAELVCMWFDNYHPEAALQKQAFSDGEAEALSAFHHVFEQHVADLPATLSALHASNDWKLISAKAQEALRLCNW